MHYVHIVMVTNCPKSLKDNARRGRSSSSAMTSKPVALSKFVWMAFSLELLI